MKLKASHKRNYLMIFFLALNLLLALTKTAPQKEEDFWKLEEVLEVKFHLET